MSTFDHLLSLIIDRTAVVGICGLGYVGLPLSAATVRAGYRVIGFDINASHVADLNAGRSTIGAVSADTLADMISAGKFEATGEFHRQGECDVLIMCVPTPLDHDRQPDLRFVEETTRTIAGSLREGQLVVLESTTYPGTTEDVVQEILEASGFKSGEDFFVGYSPEREDPGNINFETSTIPKVVAGEGAEALTLVKQFYCNVVRQVVPVSDTRTAEAVKLTENIFRAVNIALVNELKIIYEAMGIDVWEVIAAAETKPFGYMPFYPGPGLGGHCIPIDPFYLSWKSRQFGLDARFIELAGEINVSMPGYVIDRLKAALRERAGRELDGARVLLVGMAYKKDVSDTRESPSLMLMRLLVQAGAHVSYHDPLVPVVPETREYPELADIGSEDLGAARLSDFDAVLIATDHSSIDYGAIAERAKLIIDTRNVIERRGYPTGNVVKA